MRSSNFLSALVLLVSLACAPTTALSQPSSPPQGKPPVETPTERLSKARTVMVIYARGNTIPFDVIKSTLEGWVRFTVVEAPEKADLIVEVSTTGGAGEGRVTAPDGPYMQTGRAERSNSASKEASNSEITMTVYDAKNKRVLWTATETAKSAFKQTTRENNLVEAAERLASKFHDCLEPPLPRGQD